MTQLDRFLKEIDPKNNVDHYNSILDNAINTFKFPGARINTAKEYENVMGEFYWHVNTHMYGNPDKFSKFPINDDQKWRFCQKYLEIIFGSGKSYAGVDIAKSGVEGGLYSILEKLGAEIAKEHIKSAISTKVAQFFKELEYDYEKVSKVVNEYIDKYGHLLPPESTANRGADLKADFIGAMSHHPYLIKRMREVGKI